MRKILYIITLINICFQIIYVLFGSYADTELTFLKYIFYVFRPEYMIISGIVAFFVACGLLVLIIKSTKRMWLFDIFVILINVEYIIYYQRFLMTV